MYWNFPGSFTGGSLGQESQADSLGTPSMSGYQGPSTVHSASTSGPPYRDGDRRNPSSLRQSSPPDAAAILAQLKDKSLDQLRNLLLDKDAYEAFFQSLDEVKDQKNLHNELQAKTLQLARQNLEKEPRILELKNQCMVIRTTELAAAQEKLDELQRQKEEVLRLYSPPSLIRKLHDAMQKTDDESEALQQQFLQNEIDMASFVQKYRKLRSLYHKQALIHLAARTSF